MVWLLAGPLGLNSKGSRRPSPCGRRVPERCSPLPPPGGLQGSAWRFSGSGARWEALARSPSPPAGSNGSSSRGPPAPEPPCSRPGPTSVLCAGAGAGRSGPARVHLGGAPARVHPGAGAGSGSPRAAHLIAALHSPARTPPRRPHPARGAAASAAARPGRGAQGTPRRRRCCCCCRPGRAADARGGGGRQRAALPTLPF